MLKKTIVLFCFMASIPVQANPFCQGVSNEECAARFAREMTDTIKNVRTGRGPFALDAITSSGSKITMTYRGVFTAHDFSAFLAEHRTTKQDFLKLTHADFAKYQCDGPIKVVVSRGITIHNVLTLSDGGELDSFDLTKCP